MAFYKCWLILTITLCVIGIGYSGHGHGHGHDDDQLLSQNFYQKTCPRAVETIRKAVVEAVFQEPRMGASLLRLHFHDCFVQGCDASVLLDDTANFIGEKNSLPNKDSLRGFEVIDSIKSQLESMCPSVVSCADILALAARDAVFALKGPRWEVQLGRRDSTTASLSESNSDLPAPFFNLSALITAFQKKNFNIQEMVTLSGGHTIGSARCTFFRDRIYNESNIDPSFAEAMRALCPSGDGDGDDNLAPFDSTTPDTFDNAFYQNLVNQRGLVHSDQQLYANGAGITDSQVIMYSRNFGRFKKDFGDAMVKMSLLSPLTGNDGQIRTNCRFVNN
ncbi:NAD(+) salvage pathway protein [Stylosanthes scabra]|uniref:Peroxidase n=1 Tax=Stylosanthes scabra TaxID=79078 RepID=A0ABU6UER6_9FABA|nr:NAD(+) salvage pathway protein [Stylosanthes scabra]